MSSIRVSRGRVNTYKAEFESFFSKYGDIRVRTLNPSETNLYNDGERLLPGVTHSIDELVRHQSSYEFFKALITADLRREGRYGQDHVTIVDLGFGVGHGCKTLSTIPGSLVTGVDVSEDCKQYAQDIYGASNITYTISDIPEFIKTMQPYDYIVSRGVIEHVHDGIPAMLGARYTKRVIFDVPYNEPAGINQHHVLSEITEKDFESFKNKELFFEESSGRIYAGVVQEPIPNMIMCVGSSSGMPSAGSTLAFPISPWEPHPAMALMAKSILELSAELDKIRQAMPVLPEKSAERKGEGGLLSKIFR